jgi:hypothetical protein
MLGLFLFNCSVIRTSVGASKPQHEQTIEELDVSEKFPLVEPRQLGSAVDMHLVLVALACLFDPPRLIRFLSLHDSIIVIVSFLSLS